jgi:hypothetical protein
VRLATDAAAHSHAPSVHSLLGSCSSFSAGYTLRAQHRPTNSIGVSIGSSTFKKGMGAPPPPLHTGRLPCGRRGVHGVGHLRPAVEKLRIGQLRFGTGRQNMVLGRWTNPKLSTRTCSPRYGLHPGRESAGAKRPRELISHPMGDAKSSLAG